MTAPKAMVARKSAVRLVKNCIVIDLTDFKILGKGLGTIYLIEEVKTCTLSDLGRMFSVKKVALRGCLTNVDFKLNPNSQKT
jgi:hypothetical protein